MKKQILIVEDDPSIGNMLEEVLIQEGYSVLRAYSGSEALLVLKQNLADLVLLDLMLPGLDGRQVLSSLSCQIPVIVISAKAEMEDKIDLLTSGAVDYVTKPFHIQELLARIKIHLRLSSAPALDGSLSFQNLKFIPDLHEAIVNEQKARLTPSEALILEILMTNPKQAVSKSALIERLSFQSPDCSESSLKMHVSNLRKKLKQISGCDYIEAVWGIGFRLKSSLEN